MNTSDDTNAWGLNVIVKPNYRVLGQRVRKDGPKIAKELQVSMRDDVLERRDCLLRK